MLSESESVSIRKLSVGSTNNVLKHVILGKADAGAVLDAFLVREPSRLSEQIRIIFTTEPISPHPIAAHPRVSQSVRDRVVKAVLDLAGDTEGEEILQAVKMPGPQLVNVEQDYKNLEEIDIEGLGLERLIKQ